MYAGGACACVCWSGGCLSGCLFHKDLLGFESHEVTCHYMSLYVITTQFSHVVHYLHNLVASLLRSQSAKCQCINNQARMTGYMSVLLARCPCYKSTFLFLGGNTRNFLVALC